MGVTVLAVASARALAQDASNPVVASAKEIFQRQCGDKNGYHPAPEQWVYARSFRM